METNLLAEIESLKALALKKGAMAKEISSDDIVVSQWVRFKCRYGCKGYGKHLGCPPYAPLPDDTRRMVDEYSLGLLLWFEGVPGRGEFGPDDIPDDFHPWYADLIRWVNGTVHELEKTAFYDGFYKAFGFGGYPCIWCEHQHCVAEEADGIVDESIRRKCRHMDLVRPSMEAAGIDVFATARNIGWELSTIPCKNMEYGKIVHAHIHSVGLVLIE
jgi:predicted metal-binding protein